MQEIDTKESDNCRDQEEWQDVQQNEYDTDSDTETQIPDRDDINDDFIFHDGKNHKEWQSHANQVATWIIL